MKRFYLLASVLLAATTLTAQIQFVEVDFEDLTLDTDTCWYGLDESGFFTSHDSKFNNQFTATPDGGYWSGFAYSNKTDNITPGYLNMYSAYPASGADGSEIYAINYEGDTITLSEANSGFDMESVAITNTTYTYLSMRDGDDYAKKFGSTTDADGNEDGTDGKDFYIVTITGLNADKDIVASVDFHLADFTSDDADDHYIIDEWTTVDLSALINVKYLVFSYQSSDEAPWGINTPTYSAIDNLKYYSSSVGLATENKVEFNLYPNPANHTVNIEGENGLYTIYGLNGTVAMEIEVNGLTQVDVSSLTPGMYFVKNAQAATSQKLIIQ